jgi:hypothetical protein
MGSRCTQKLGFKFENSVARREGVIDLWSASDGISPSISTIGLETLIFSNALAAVAEL